ncbi:MAG TPA: FxsA family protein [Virgibacillus sp.]|nr:FxsA family protein [Virgibacillus sp.]
MRWLLLAFLIVPALEIGIFVWVGGSVGAWGVVGLILLTGIAGAAFARIQGLETLNRARLLMRNGQAPTEQLIDGICILVGGILLVAPGFITDIVGLLLVLPFTRAAFKVGIMRWITWKMSKGKIIFRK